MNLTRRLYQPMPDSLREVPAQDRRRITKAVRRGEGMETRKEARIAIDAADWMISQLNTSYLQLLATPISLGSIAVLAVLGVIRYGALGVITNVLPFLGVMYLLRLVTVMLFRKAPAARAANEDRLRRRRSRG